MQDFPAVHLDFETRSATDLKKAGVYRYAEDPTTWPWGFAWQVEFEAGNYSPVYQWRPGYADPTYLLDHVRQGGRVVVHNAAFERTIWNWVLVGRIVPHWPPMNISQQDCTMARAASVALPQALEKLGIALKSNFQKDMQGHNLMMKMAKPRRFNADGSVTWWDDPEDVDRNMAYCEQDVRTEGAADAAVPQLSPEWRKVWEFDQVINERGVCIDQFAVERSAQVVEYAKKQNDKVMREITNRAVSKCSKDKEIIAWLNGRGIEATSLAKGEVDDVVFLASCHMDDTAHDVIKLRQAAWKTSTAKYRAMQQCVSYDGRIRGLLNFHGASTGRWAGRLVQPQNFPRVDPDDKELQVKIAFLHDLLNDRALNARDIYEHIDAVYGPLEALSILSKALRSMLVAAKGKKFIGGDFSNIEGRVNSWLACEAWKLNAFREYDTGTGPDLYKLAYARSFGVDVESVGKGQKRQIGKVQELALGYQGGVGAYLTMGATYGVNPFDLSKPVYDATSAEQWDTTAAQYYAPRTSKYGLFEREWTALKILVDNWRAANAAVVQQWWDYQDAAIGAVGAPGNVVYTAGQRVSYYSDGRCLWCILPSGRMLCYSEPELVEELVEYTDKNTGETKTRVKRKVTFWGNDSVTKQWTKQSLYGGLQCENIVQAASCDLLVDAMFRVEAAGYPVILTVHDEILSEPDDWRQDLNERHFAELMSVLPTWANGLPVSVGAWEDTRYVK